MRYLALAPICPIPMIRAPSDNSCLPSPHGFAIGALPSRSPVNLVPLFSLDPDRRRSVARVAQLVEHMTENHGVGGSIPSPGTTVPFG